MALQLVFNPKVAPAAHYTPRAGGGWFFKNLFTSDSAPAPKALVWSPFAALNNLMRF